MIITQEIIDALKEDFGSITTFNGYNSDLLLCHSIYKTLDNIKDDEFDSFYVEGMPSKANYGEDFIEWQWGIGVYFYLKVPDDVVENGEIQKKIEKLKTDIRTLIASPLKVEAIDAVRAIKLLYSEPYINNGNSKALFLLLLEINYID
jgi:hypothetical protein